MRIQYLSIAFVAVVLLFPVAEQQPGLIPRGSDGVVIAIGVLAMFVLFTEFVLPRPSKGLGSTTQHTGSCPSPYVEYEDRCYEFIRNAKSWADAQAYCVANKADLISIETQAEDLWISEKLDSGQDIEFLTPAIYTTTLFEVDDYGIDFNGEWISFYTKANGNAFIILKDMKGDTDNVYSIGIGIAINSRVSIYRGYVTASNKVADASIGGLLDSSEFRPFWVGYKTGHLQIGRGLEKGKMVVLEWTDTTPFDINYIAVSSLSSGTVEWKFNTGRQYWTSGTLDSESEYYFWGTGESAELGYENWKNSEPNVASEDGCLALDGSWDNDGKWREEICECKLSFVCEKGLE